MVPFQSVDKVYTLWQTEKNVGILRAFFLVGVVVYGRGKNALKADVAGFCPLFQSQMISSRKICFMQILLLTSALYQVCLRSEKAPRMVPFVFDTSCRMIV